MPKNLKLLLFIAIPISAVFIYEGYQQKDDSIEGQWEIIDGSHFEKGQEAWLEISDSHFNLYGPVPGSNTGCLEKLILKIEKVDEEEGFKLINPEYQYQQFLLYIKKNKGSDQTVTYQLNNRQTDMHFTAQKSPFSERNLNLCGGSY